MGARASEEAMKMIRRLAAVALAAVTLSSLSACSHSQATPTPAAPMSANVVRSAVRADLAAHRDLQLARLHAYAEAGLFPRNSTSDAPLHMFKDPDGRLCAVANLVHQDGLDDLVDATARTQNDVALADVTSGPLYAWALASGLTMEEIARIQRPAPRISQPPKGPYTGDPLDPRTNFQSAASSKPVAIAKPAPKPAAPRAADEDAMRAELRAHFAAVEAQIAAGTDASLDVAVARWLAAQPAS
jgi:hypothetical protein